MITSSRETSPRTGCELAAGSCPLTRLRQALATAIAADQHVLPGSDTLQLGSGGSGTRAGDSNDGSRWRSNGGTRRDISASATTKTKTRRIDSSLQPQPIASRTLWRSGLMSRAVINPPIVESSRFRMPMPNPTSPPRTAARPGIHS